MNNFYNVVVFDPGTANRTKRNTHSDNCIQLHSVPRSKMVRERYGEKVSSLEC